jgi:peptidoglycan/LPS O-acetylase OafA/YrhL
MTPEPITKMRIAALDGWRGIAILLVLIDHSAESARWSLAHKATRVGATGVGIFFALSGFLITSRLLAEYHDTGSISFKKFYVRRAFRLMPPALLYLAVLAILTAFGLAAVTKAQWYSSLLFYRNYTPAMQQSSGWFTGHFWSLNVEEHFYMLWPALLTLTRRRVLIPTLLALSVAAWRFVDIHYHVISSSLWLPGRTDVRLDSLLWGCIFAVVLSFPDLKKLVSRYLTSAAVLVLAAIDVVSNAMHGQHDYSPYEPLIIALIVIWPIVRPMSVFSALLEWPLLKWVGRLSYSLYIWQQLWLLFPGAPASLGRFQQIPLNLAAAFAAAALSYYLVEKPMIGLGHRLTGSWPGHNAAIRSYVQGDPRTIQAGRVLL